jgi:preprotein translocase subunit SecA
MAGRGVDILLGGNPEGLARDAVRAEGLDPATDEGAVRYAVLLAQFESECAAEADEVRALGGLYVLGSERHESRRIDNQLRGRAGRQGDPGESRFFLSLEDELMRLFASGAMNWVMDRALPDDVPIEARMVSKAIERAQNTVEARNAEVRKDVLKYDAVMNEQRKVIYERRLQILDGDDLREYTLELLETTLTRAVHDACPNDFAEEWDLERLVAEMAQYYPTEFTVEDLEQAESVDQILDSVIADATEHFEGHEQAMPGGPEMARQVERQIMMQIIDQRWRQHLSEMDYLREGIHLRGIAQTDPLNAWQREGFELFGKLMDSIDDDYLRYVMHVQLLVEQEVAPDYSTASFEAADDPAAGLANAATLESVAFEDAVEPVVAPGPAVEPEVPSRPAPTALAARPQPAPTRPTGGGGARPGPAAPRRAPSSLSGPGSGATLAGTTTNPGAKLGRNDPCYCGSGKKFKLCHGAV